VVRRLEHFVLTNFNVRRDDCRRDRNGQPVDRSGVPVRTSEWLQERFALFERFCLPSLVAQTCLDFTWLLGYDAVGTPPEFLRRLEAYEAAFSNLQLVPEPTPFRQAVAGRSNSRRRLLTTRLDSDDALSRTAIALLQRHATGDDLEFLNLPLGYCYSYPDGRTRVLRDDSNHFLSLAENGDAGQPRTAVCVNHNRAREVAPVRQISHRPSWLQVIHRRNMQNDLQGEPCAPPDLGEMFNVQADLDEWATPQR